MKHVTPLLLLIWLYVAHIKSMESIPEIGDTHIREKYIFKVYDKDDKTAQHLFNWHIKPSCLQYIKLLTLFQEEYTFNQYQNIELATKELSLQSAQLAHSHLQLLDTYTEDEDGDEKLYQHIKKENCETIAQLATITNYLGIPPLFKACCQALYDATTPIISDKHTPSDTTFFDIDPHITNNLEHFKNIRREVTKMLFEKHKPLTFWLVAHAYNNRINELYSDTTIELANQHVPPCAQIHLNKPIAYHNPREVTKIRASKIVHNLFLNTIHLPEVYLLHYLFHHAEFKTPLNLGLTNMAWLYPTYESFSKKHPSLTKIINQSIAITLPNVIGKC